MEGISRFEDQPKLAVQLLPIAAPTRWFSCEAGSGTPVFAEGAQLAHKIKPGKNELTASAFFGNTRMA